MIGSLLQADFEEIIAAKNWDELRKILTDLDPPATANLIIDLPPEVEGIIFRLMHQAENNPLFLRRQIDDEVGGGRRIEVGQNLAQLVPVLRRDDLFKIGLEERPDHAGELSRASKRLPTRTERRFSAEDLALVP